MPKNRGFGSGKKADKNLRGQCTCTSYHLELPQDFQAFFLYSTKASIAMVQQNDLPASSLGACQGVLASLLGTSADKRRPIKSTLRLKKTPRVLPSTWYSEPKSQMTFCPNPGTF
ncbi:hypothetical protein TWF281_008544 [Arthrobotrys megalospora]